jgi:hypothetical protein
MRRIDAITLTLAFFLLGGLAYVGLQWLGVSQMNAGVWSQVVLVTVLVGWLVSYLLRVVTKNMTYDRQLENYKTAVFKKRLEEMSPEEIAQLQAEVAAEKREKVSDS